MKTHKTTPGQRPLAHLDRTTQDLVNRHLFYMYHLILTPGDSGTNSQYRR